VEHESSLSERYQFVAALGDRGTSTVYWCAHYQTLPTGFRRLIKTAAGQVGLRFAPQNEQDCYIAVTARKRPKVIPVLDTPKGPLAITADKAAKCGADPWPLTSAEEDPDLEAGHRYLSIIIIIMCGTE